MKEMKGKRIAEEKLSFLKEDMERKGLSLSLAVVRVGEDPVSSVYVKRKKEELSRMGISVSIYDHDEKIEKEKLKENISSLEEDGIIVQLPLPKNLNAREVIDAIPEKKDVDLLSSSAIGKFYTGMTNTFPPVVGAVETLLEEYEIDCKGKNVVLMGAGALVGKPLSLYFLKKEATVSVLNAYTKQPERFTKEADILVSGVGRPGLVKGDMVKKNVVIIDAGTSSSGKKLKGDVDMRSVNEKASLVTPVPGGVGPLTIYHLANNLKILNDGR